MKRTLIIFAALFTSYTIGFIVAKLPIGAGTMLGFLFGIVSYGAAMLLSDRS